MGASLDVQERRVGINDDRILRAEVISRCPGGVSVPGLYYEEWEYIGNAIMNKSSAQCGQQSTETCRRN